MRYSFIIVLLSYQFVAAQQWAGPDGVSCGELGFVIGSQDPCPDCCYIWSPAQGLNCTDCKNPRATPKSKTTYTVVVTDKNLSWKKTDAVVVDVVFGEMQFTPDHLVQGTSETVNAKVLKLNTSNITWQINGNALGCSLDQQGTQAVVSPGTEYGTIQVRATNNDVPGCYVQEPLPINNGVKDVWAVDLQHPGRIAKAGGTLYVVGHGDVQIQAIPNEGGFAPGIPDWKNDLIGNTVPEDGVAIQIMTESTSVLGAEAEYIAGDDPEYEPRVAVVRKTPVTDEQDVAGFITGFVAYFQNVKTRINSLFGGQQGDFPCVTMSPFDAEITASVKYKETDVEKYRNPGMGLKREYVADATYNFSGRVYEPRFTGTYIVPFTDIGICSQLYVGLNAGGQLALSIVSDDSQESTEWKIDNPQLEFSVGAEAKIEVVCLVTGWAATATGSAYSTVKFPITYDYTAKTIKGQVKLNPMNMKFEAKVGSISNMGEIKNAFNIFSKEIQLWSGSDFDPFTIYTHN